MDDKTLIAKRVAMELRPGYLVNLGIGLPTLVASLVPRDANIFSSPRTGSSVCRLFQKRDSKRRT